jgi:VanZ family protein
MTFPARTKTFLAVLYFMFISVLFFLPGSVLPKEDWLSKIYFDKWVHVGFFTVLLFLWLWALMPGKRGAVWVLAMAILYGIAVEFIQDRFIPNRSFDLGDWAADSFGSFAGLWLWGRYIKK